MKSKLDAQNLASRHLSEVRVSVTEGKHRMVRRMLHNAGHSVLQLHRVRYGSIELGDLMEGSCRPASASEWQWIPSD